MAVPMASSAAHPNTFSAAVLKRTILRSASVAMIASIADPTIPASLASLISSCSWIRLRSVISVTIAMRQGSPSISINSAEPRPARLAIFARKRTPGCERAFSLNLFCHPCPLGRIHPKLEVERCPVRLLRHVASQSFVRKFVDIKVAMVFHAVTARAIGLFRKALENFSSDFFSASSASLRSVMSTDMPSMRSASPLAS